MTDGHEEIDGSTTFDDFSVYAEDVLRDAIAECQDVISQLRDIQHMVAQILAVTGHEKIDGCHHPHTREIHDRFNASGFALSPWWAMTPTDWVCPGCGRSKDRIARLDKNGRLMGKLFEHHDHMDGILQRKFQEIAACQTEVVADTDAKRFAQRLAPGISAFDPVVICQDCNNADANAKKLAGCDRDFSFPVQDIVRFVRPKDNAAHEIDPDSARKAWAEAKPAHEVRMQVVVRLATIAATRSHWYRPAPPGTSVAHRERAVRLQILTTTGLDSRLHLHKELWTDYEPKAPASDAWRRNLRRRTRVPTEGEISTCAQVSHVGHWMGVPDTWQCPVCQRNKRAVVRESQRFGSSNPFTFMVWSVSFVDVGRVIVCEACWSDKVALEKEAGVKHGQLSAESFRRVIKPVDHQRHGLDTIAIENLIESLRNGKS